MLWIFTWLHMTLARALRREDGQGLTEYALIVTLIAVVAIVALKLLGRKVTTALSSVASSV